MLLACEQLSYSLASLGLFKSGKHDFTLTFFVPLLLMSIIIIIV